MSNPSLSGGGSVSLDDVLVMLFGSSYSGTSTDAGSGFANLLSILDTATSTGRSQ
jgi:hypothetical protein